jgi:hypothetical protein
MPPFGRWSGAAALSARVRTQFRGDADAEAALEAVSRARMDSVTINDLAGAVRRHRPRLGVPL